MAGKKQGTKAQKAGNKQMRKPKQVTWQDDLGIGYATYEHEEDYVNPIAIEELGAKQVKTIRSFNQRLAMAPVFAEEVA